jgi:hypothetical protein
MTRWGARFRQGTRDAIDERVEAAVRRAWEQMQQRTPLRVQYRGPRAYGARLLERAMRAEVDHLDAQEPPA